jgi:SAM-dependent methyltransferase
VPDDGGPAAAAFARLYDLDLEAEDPGDLELYLALAERTGGPILELAAGSGRIAVPVAAAGHRVTAVDHDPAMLARARARAAEDGAEIALELVEVDLLDLEASPLPARGIYRLAILALNSLFLLATREAQATAMRVMAAHLAPGGLAVVDIWLPTAGDLARYDGRLLLDGVREDPRTGAIVTKSWAATHDAVAQTVLLTTIYEEGRPGEAPVRWVRRDAMRLVSADELWGIAESAGLAVEVLAGDRDLSPIGPGAERAVLVAVRP